MRKRALLIGSRVGELKGVENDVARIDALLGTLGFSRDLRLADNATRSGILDGYERLIHDSRDGDAVLVYYSGHGCYASNPEYDPLAWGKTVPPYFQAIVPYDIWDSSLDDFRGILSLELSDLMNRLSHKTDNVTAIFDCCHAAGISRDAEFRVKALPDPLTTGVAEHLIKTGIAGRVAVFSNPNAVRLVASELHQPAFERGGRRGRPMGFLTEAFCLAVEQANGTAVTWDALGKRIRERVLALTACQRPAVEGPDERVLFHTDQAEKTGVLSLFYEDSQPFLRGGNIMGVAKGSTYAVMPMTASRADARQELARAEVLDVWGGKSRVKLSPHDRAVPSGARAFPLVITRRKRLVVLAEGTEALLPGLQASQFLRPVGAVETREEVLAEVHRQGRRILIHDLNDKAVAHPAHYDAGGIAATVENLELMAKARSLRELEGGVGRSALKSRFRLEWGRLSLGGKVPLNRSGAQLTCGDRVFVQLFNQGEATLHVSIFDIGVSRKISLLNSEFPAGIPITQEADYCLGRSPGGKLEGLPLHWPATVPKDGPRPESLVVIVSDRPQELGAHQTRRIRASSLGDKRSHLQNILQGITSAQSSPARDEVVDVRYSVVHICFMNTPVKEGGWPGC